MKNTYLVGYYDKSIPRDDRRQVEISASSAEMYVLYSLLIQSAVVDVRMLGEDGNFFRCYE